MFYRKRDGVPPNNLLNYGYAILRATMARAITGAGLLPTLGIFHRNRYNAYCLADDIMEPYRPFVDEIVRSIIDKTSAVETLTQELKVQLLKLPTVDVQLGDETSPLMIATQRTAASLAKCYTGETRKILYPEMP
jgi:CRISP-associated protein Cas1